MTISLRNMSLALALMVSAAPLMTVHADAKASFMAECSAKFKAAKAANSLGADTKWTDFMKHQCAADASAAAPAAPAAPAVVAAPAKTTAPVKAPKAAAPAVAAAPATTTSGSFMQNCSTAWKAMKTANTVPAGMKWKDFVAAKCVVDGTAPAAAATPVVAAKPTKVKKPAVVMQDETPAEPAAAVDATPMKTMDKNGKPFSPGQMAAHSRARACGQKWRAEKAAGTLQVGLKWPQYWSACNTELKAAGQ
jgi:hypothetical protein